MKVSRLSNPGFVRRHAHRGFTMIELMVVMALVAVLAAFGLPALKERQIEGKAPELAKAVQGAITKLRNNHDGAVWTGVSNDELVAIMTSDARVVVDGTNKKVFHNLGDPTGEMIFASGNVTTAGDSGRITLDKVNGAGCPIVANALKNFAVTMSVNGTSAKAAGGAYSGGVAQAACTGGDTNTLVVQFN